MDYILEIDSLRKEYKNFTLNDDLVFISFS